MKHRLRAFNTAHQDQLKLKITEPVWNLHSKSRLEKVLVDIAHRTGASAFIVHHPCGAKGLDGLSWASPDG